MIWIFWLLTLDGRCTSRIEVPRWQTRHRPDLPCDDPFGKGNHKRCFDMFTECSVNHGSVQDRQTDGIERYGRMTLRIAKYRYASLVVAFVAALAMAMAGAGAARAGITEIRNLPGKTWTCGSCESGTWHSQYAEAYESASTICVGPVTYNGSWHVPYGWTCAGHVAHWEYTPISSYPGVYNPNSGTFKLIFSLWS